VEEILSVGIDIGTSTTQLVFSRLAIGDTAGFFSAPRIVFLGKRVVYKSGVYFTPLLGPTAIDGAAVREIVAREYEKAGFRPQDVSTGAVIITGESARKENAAEVLRRLSDFAGDFVVSTAGPDLESVIAGKGSGAFQKSLEQSSAVVNLDVGGGTTNVVRFAEGEAVSVGCLDVGGRLVRIGAGGLVESVSPAAGEVMKELGISLRPGEPAAGQTLRRVTDRMALLLAELLGLAPAEPLLARVKTPGSSDYRPAAAQEYVFSGGVAACMEREEQDVFAYGDIGVLLARSIRSLFQTLPCRFRAGAETVRATVVGAGTYTTSLSGGTISYTDGVFPIKNLPVLRLTAREEADCFRGDGEGLRQRLGWFLRQSDTGRAAVCLRGKPDPDYEELKNLARSLSDALNGALEQNEPVVVSVECDIAKALGNTMRRLLPDRRVAVIDSVRVGQMDYLDIGKPLMNGLAVPVVVKSLLFG